MDYLEELQAIYDNEVNFLIRCEWDAGWHVAIGSNLHGWDCYGKTDTLEQAVEWLIKTIKEKYSESGYAKRRETP